MSRPSLSSPALPAKAIANGSTADNPGRPHSLAWSTIENAVVIWNGTAWWKQGEAPGSTLALVSAGDDLDNANLFDPALAGVDRDAARSDHLHDGSQIVGLTVGEGVPGDLNNALEILQQIATGAMAAASIKPSLITEATAGTLATGAPQADDAGTDDTAARSDHTHPIASTTNDGLMSAAQVTQLAASGATPLAATAPAAVTKAAATVGVAVEAARADHKHDVTTAAPVSIGTANTEGTATSLARSDHVHAGLALTSSTPVAVTKATAAVGVVLEAARADHKHDVTTAVPVSIGTANTEGTATSLARSDHVHAGLLSLATASTAGTLATGAPQAAQAGNATTAARSDHTHPVASGSNAGLMSAAQATSLAACAPLVAAGSDLGNAAAFDLTLTGIATTSARSDHFHDGSQVVGISLGESPMTLDAAIEALRVMAVQANNNANASPDLVASDVPGTLATGAPKPENAGASDEAARSDHQHPLATTTNDGLMSKAQVVQLAAAGGTSFPTAASAGTLTVGAPQPSEAGSATTAARSDHQHPPASGTNEGLMSSADWTKLSGVASGATAVTMPTITTAGTLASGAPQAAQAGSLTTAARSDHQHPAAAAGNAGLFSAADFSKLLGIQAGATNTAAPPAGPAAAPPDVSSATGGIGSLTGNFARQDHTHGHGDIVGTVTVNDHHSAATASIYGFMSPGDFSKLGGIAAGATNTAAPPAAPGIAPPLIGTLSTIGTAGTYAAALHTHGHGSQTDGTMHAAATASVAGFMSAAQATQLAGIGATYVRVKAPGNQSIGSHTNTQITLTNKIQDSKNAFASNGFTCPSSGIYFISSYFEVTDNGSGNAACDIVVAGATVATCNMCYRLNSSRGSMAIITYLTAGQLVTFNGVQQSGAAQTVWFAELNIFKIG